MANKTFYGLFVFVSVAPHHQNTPFGDNDASCNFSAKRGEWEMRKSTKVVVLDAWTMRMSELGRGPLPDLEDLVNSLRVCVPIHPQVPAPPLSSSSNFDLCRFER